jgi:hypothetical protein
MGISTSQNSNAPEGLESRLSVRIHRIPAKLLHSTEPELRKLRRTQMDSSRASARATLRTPDKPGSPSALRTSPLSLLYKD